jgi:hybrid cluster-associated redox disulfide protein
MTMDHAWKHHPAAPAIFARHHLPGCDSCAVRFDETLEEAASAYDLDLDLLLEELNSLLRGP